MKPSIWIYGGVHYDPGSRLRFLQEIAKHEAAPHFVAVEWGKSVFEGFAARRPWVAERLGQCREFLTPQDCEELSLALAWEADAHKKDFPNADRLWLETGFQETDFKQRYGTDLPNIAQSFAESLVDRLCNPCRPTMKEWASNVDPPDPKSKEELIDRVWTTVWEEASEERNFERDLRWAHAVLDRCSSLHGGWIAVVVGWAHADPAAGDQGLRNLLVSKGFVVNSICLGSITRADSIIRQH